MTQSRLPGRHSWSLSRKQQIFEAVSANYLGGCCRKDVFKNGCSMNTVVNTLSSPELSSCKTAEEVVLFAREQRSVVGLQYALLLVKELAKALQQQRKAQDTSLSDVFARKKSLERLLLKELGVWCYLAYLQGASYRYLDQAEVCFSHMFSFEDLDAELEMYYAFILWSKWQEKQAQPGDMKQCFTLLSRCSEAESFQVSQLDVVWFRLGYLYQVGAGCKQDTKKAEVCFEQARNLGLDC